MYWNEDFGKFRIQKTMNMEILWKTRISQVLLELIRNGYICKILSYVLQKKSKYRDSLNHVKH